MTDFPNSLDDFDGVAAFVVLFGASRAGEFGGKDTDKVGLAILEETGEFILQEQGGDILEEGL